MKYDLALALTYYTPYVSGLTNVARDVAEGLARRGWRVAVVTTRHRGDLPTEEDTAGVHVIRTPVLASLGKGTVSPSFIPTALRVGSTARVTNLHLPLLEAGPIAALCRGPVVVTYHCDVSLPPGLMNGLQRRMIDASSRRALRSAVTVTVSSIDYARSSRLWPAMNQPVAIAPPCHDRSGGRPTYRDGPGLHIGFLGRIVEEKGVEYLVDGFLGLEDPDARLLVAGEFEDVAGGSVIERVRRRMGDDPRIRLLGFVPDDALPDFYASIDVLALPSVNAFEAFGIVQVEAMMCGVPALASDLPGVRQPVQQTGFGVVVRRANAEAVRDGLKVLYRLPADPHSGAIAARRLYGMEAVLDAYESVLTAAAGRPGRRATSGRARRRRSR